jgi:hypothetical protein
MSAANDATMSSCFAKMTRTLSGRRIHWFHYEREVSHVQNYTSSFVLVCKLAVDEMHHRYDMDRRLKLEEKQFD